MEALLHLFNIHKTLTPESRKQLFGLLQNQVKLFIPAASSTFTSTIAEQFSNAMKDYRQSQDLKEFKAFLKFTSDLCDISHAQQIS